MLLSFAFGICPPQSSLRRHVGQPCGRPRHRGAHLHLALPKELPVSYRSRSLDPSSSSPRWSCFVRFRGYVQDHFACGSLRRLPIHAHAAPRHALRRCADRPGLPPQVRLVSRICRPFSGRIVHGLPPFRGFSPPSPRNPLGSRCPPCRFPPCGAAAPRIRAVGDIAPCGALATSCGCVLRRRRCSRHRRAAPLLVVSPLRG